MKRKIRLFTTVMVCMAMALCVSCKKDDDKSDDGGDGVIIHEYVDLGLPSGTLWAKCNVGANKPEEYGNYYAWGEISVKRTYKWSTYKWCNGSETSLTKYNTQSGSGTVDDKTVLDPEDDVAHVNWGGVWRMPTHEELQELAQNCTWEWTTLGGKKGHRITGSNGNSIFLPAAGCYYNGNVEDADSWGGYWSNSIDSDDPCGAYVLASNSGGAITSGRSDRYLGFTVRPVR